MAASVNSPKFPCQIKKIKQANNQNCSDCFDFESLSKSSCSTLKRNPKMELSKPDLITLLSYLEGELQARDIVIATLKCEKMKYMLKYGPSKSSSVSDPIAALCRDNFAAQTGSYDQLADYEHQPNPLEPLVTQQRRSLIHMAKIFKEAELRHKKVIQEVVECPKRKLQDGVGDELINGLGDDPSFIKQDIVARRLARKRLDSDIKHASDVDDKMRQKQIVLLLLAERKKIVMKYIEERKRSEDLAQILSEEKGRIDSMAEGLEEESKKSLQMEAELEKQIAQFDSESQVLRTNLLKEEKRVRELECELEKVRSEAALCEKQLTEMQQIAAGQPSAIIHNRPGSQLSMRAPGAVSVHSNPSVVGNVAKVVQPTATVSSVPVTGPTTGVARSVPSSQNIRGIGYSPPLQATVPSAKNDKRPTVGVSNNPSKPLPQNSQTPSSANGNTDKKPVVTRGVPPPVPPNKPVLLPKKDAAFKRVESIPCNSDTVKMKKDIKICPAESADNSLIQNNSETYSNVKAASE